MLTQILKMVKDDIDMDDIPFIDEDESEDEDL